MITCPCPDLIGMDLQDREIGPGIYGIGYLAWNSSEGLWQCMANIEGKLCLVEVSVRPSALDLAQPQKGKPS